MSITAGQLSAAVGSVQVATAQNPPGTLLRVMSVGMPLITGGSSSVTVMVKDELLPLP